MIRRRAWAGKSGWCKPRASGDDPVIVMDEAQELR